MKASRQWTHTHNAWATSTNLWPVFFDAATGGYFTRAEWRLSAAARAALPASRHRKIEPVRPYAHIPSDQLLGHRA